MAKIKIKKNILPIVKAKLNGRKGFGNANTCSHQYSAIICCDPIGVDHIGIVMEHSFLFPV